MLALEHKIKVVSSKKEALKVWKMFLIPNIIGPLTNGEKEKFKQNILATLKNPKGKFFYVQLDGKVIGAIGAWENHISNGGYVIENFAVVPGWRGKGVGSELFDMAEQFVLKHKPRYIIIETGDDEFYKTGRKIYSEKGYVRVSHYPKYFCETSGMIGFMKSFEPEDFKK